MARRSPSSRRRGARPVGIGSARARSAQIAGVGLVLVLFLGCPEGEASVSGGGSPPGTTVEIVGIEPELLRNLVKIPGQLTAEMSVEIVPETEGVISAIELREGLPVTKGAVLLRLGDEEQRALLREAQAERDLAAAVYKRTQSLQQRDVSSAAQLERAAAELSVARSRVQGARVELDRTRIVAPFDGVIGDFYVSPGDRVTPDDKLVRIDAIDRLQLRFNLPEFAVGLVKPGIPVEIRVSPYPEERFTGEVYFISPSVDPATRRILIKGWIPNPGHRLRPGLFAEVEAELERREGALLVPESAVLHSVAGTYVWRVGEDDRAERVEVQLGLRDAGRVEVRSGLGAGDRVVTTGVHKVNPGALLRGPRGEADPPDRLEAAEGVAGERRES